jgi:eukaryotic-like serine/threonine-protein kinase
MKECPACNREFKDEVLFCPFDGQALVEEAYGDKLIGKLFDDKYLIEELLGEGGMGKVYKATHIHMGRKVAIKMLHGHLSSDRMMLERFRREARAAAQIRHSNAIAVIDFGVAKETATAYLVMEFLEGEQLKDKLTKAGRLDYAEIFQILQQTCMAVQAAHAKGIIHRDLKPDNIRLLSSDENGNIVKVLDFGIAKLRTPDENNTLTQQGTIVGTPYYMSPEQCRGEELDPRSDVYSLGVILYEMLAGEVPFHATTPMGIAHKHVTEQPRPLREKRADIPAQIEYVVMRSLNKRREDRQDSAMQLAQEYEAALNSAGIALRQMSTNTPQWAVLPDSDSHSPQTADGSLSGQMGSVTGSGHSRGDYDDTIASGAALPTAVATSTPPARQVATSPGDAALTARAAKARRQTGEGIASARGKQIYIIAGGAVFVIAAAIIIYFSLGGEGPNPPTPPTPKGPTAPPGMMLVKAGTFQMGTNDPAAKPAYKPAHKVTVAEFYMDTYEVTNADYAKFVKETGRPAPPHWKLGEYEPGKDKWPVVNVSNLDAAAYARWAKKRLPTEAEWEYAARGDKNLIYPWGNGWFEKYSNSAEDGRKEPVDVGSYPDGVSWCGVYDLAGNVAEWVADTYAPYPGSTANQEPNFWVYRGGAYIFPKEELITTTRWWDKPDTKGPWLGFRCAQDVPK